MAVHFDAKWKGACLLLGDSTRLQEEADAYVLSCRHNLPDQQVCCLKLDPTANASSSRLLRCRMGMGVTGGTPLGFDVGAKAAGSTLPGLDLGVRGMRQGGQRKLLVPPNLVRCAAAAALPCADVLSRRHPVCRPTATRARGRYQQGPRWSLTSNF